MYFLKRKPQLQWEAHVPSVPFRKGTALHQYTPRAIYTHLLRSPQNRASNGGSGRVADL